MLKSRTSLFLAVFLMIGFFLAAMPEDAQAQCEFDIGKVEVPNTGVDFDFEFTGDISDNFGLFGGETLPFEIPVDGQAILTEEIPEGYELSIECVNGVTNCGNEEFVPCLNFEFLEDGNGVIVTCLDDDTGSCTFTNTLAVRSTVPTLSEWGLVAMAGVLGVIGVMVIRRRKASA